MKLPISFFNFSIKDKALLDWSSYSRR